MLQQLPPHRKKREKGREDKSESGRDVREGGDLEENGDRKGKGVEEREESGDTDGGEGRKGGERG